MNQYKVGDLIENEDVLIFIKDGVAHILKAGTVLQVDEVVPLIVHDHFHDFGQFLVDESEVSPALMTCF